MTDAARPPTLFDALDAERLEDAERDRLRHLLAMGMWPKGFQLRIGQGGPLR